MSPAQQASGAAIDSDWAEQLAPSLYTTALLQVIETCALPPGRACEVGVGSGICLGALAARGYQELWGSDISPLCLQAAREMVSTVSQTVQLQLRTGDLWKAFEGAPRFDVIVSNLPHFPGNSPQANRLPGWQGGDGRALMDRFLLGLPDFLSPEGVALITHHDLIGLEHTNALLARRGLRSTELLRWTVYESPQRMASVTDMSLVDSCASLRQLGPYCLIDSRILMLCHSE